MSRLGDFFNRIKNTILPNKNLQLPERSTVNPVLKGKINKDTINSFENPQNYNEYCQAFFSRGDNFASQYNYLEVVSQMQSSGAMEDFEKYFSEIQGRPELYNEGQVHGTPHISRVTFFAEMLCMLDGLSNHDRDLVMRAAQFHDIGRDDDSINLDHGLAGKILIEEQGLLSQYSQRDQEIIKFAVECHSLSKEEVDARLNALPRKDRKQFKKISDYLKDADKLDRARIANKGRGLNPDRLSTDTAKRLVKVAHVNYFEFDRVIDYEAHKEPYQVDYNNRVNAFNQLRSQGYNISLEFLNSIIDKFKPGTLEMLMREDRVQDILSYETFLEHSIAESAETIKSMHAEMYSEVGANEQIVMLEETFEMEFMLYYNLKYNYPDSYNIYKYADIDMSAGHVVGNLAEMQMSDLDKFFSKGYYLRTTDLIDLASHLTPEEYRDVIDNGKLEDLFSSKYEKDPSRYNDVQRKLASHGINYSKDTIDKSYRFIEKIINVCPDILKHKDISKYSFPEIYVALSKVYDASTRISNDMPFEISAQNIIEFIDFSRKDNLIYSVSEKEQLDIAENFMHDKDAVKDPRYVQYLIKKNRPFNTKKISEILNYNEFCIDKILEDPNITLDDAKSKLINGLFNLDVPPEDRQKFEKELMEQLYYHRKYYPQSPLYKDGDNPTSRISEILSTTSIKGFKELLSQSKEAIGLIRNSHTLGDEIKAELIDISKADMVHNLQKTAGEIRLMEDREVHSKSGVPVQAKVLSGQKFYLATTTVMPRCSSVTGNIKRKHSNNPQEARNEIYRNMLEREFNPNEKCTSIVSETMLAHAASALQDQELVFGFVPESKDAMSVAGVYDLSTRRDRANNGIRRTNRPITPRGISDFVAGTTEEHNEVVMSAYPDFIICFDEISDIAIEKQRRMNEEYKRLGIGKTIEIVLVESKEKYLPQIKNNVIREHEEIKQKLATGTLTGEDFNKMFEGHESNLVLRTLQAIHSSSYRDDVWDTEYNKKVLDSMTEILEQVVEIVPGEKSRAVLNQVNILLDRADRSTDYGKRFYDHAYVEDINVSSLNQIKSKLVPKVYSHEQCIGQEQHEQTRQGLRLEEIDTAGITLDRNGTVVDTKNQRRKLETPDEGER